ncbi:MAG: acetate/propionate family kinase [Solirubrobacteraceae bacterium]
MRVLVVNAGSSSVKLSLLGDDDGVIDHREIDAPHTQLNAGALQAAVHDGLGDADAVAHRIVHGGERFRSAVLVDADLRRELQQLVALAPLHQPKALAALDAIAQTLDDLPTVACFDTAFHATLPPAASTYAIPAVWRERWQLRRYGFHGLSHSWIASRAPQLLAQAPERLRIVSAHVGAGTSLCAIRDGMSVDTTMGFTPLEGMVMATRSGSIDPGIILWLLAEGTLSGSDIAYALEHESGLLGLSGSADMREIVERSDAGDQTAQLALDVFVHHLRGGIAAMTASLGGLDVLAFTGGIGEHAAAVRASTAAGLRFLGVEIDAELNQARSGDLDVSTEHAPVRTLVIGAREDLEIARQTRALLRGSRPQ